MPNLYLPGASILLSLFLVILFFSKTREKNADTKVFKYMIVIQLFESIIETYIYYVAYTSNDTFTIILLNNFVCTFYILWVWLFYRYLFYAANNDKKPIFKDLKKIEIIANVILIFVIFISPMKIMNENGIMYSYGLKTIITYFSCGIWMSLAIIFTLLNVRNLKSKKYIPLWTLFVLAILIFIIRSVDPSIIIIPFALTFLNLVMYHTIENPDVKLINELELAKNQAEKANRAKTDFLSSMSHEIRTPLNAIVGLSNIIKDSDDLEEIHEDASDVVSASNTLLEIVNGILDISRIEADKMEVIECNYSPLEEFKTLVTLAETRIGEKDIELRTKFAEDLPEVLYGDKGKVKQIITNLLTNAVKYTENGYIDFKVNCINEDNISRLTITVKDTGRGIKKEKFDTLFTKFNRLEEDRNSTIEGTGLGLVITKALVEMMGGKIVVDSTYGEGSKFTIFLSQKIGNASNIEIVKDELNTFDGKKILIVDDNSLNIKVANKILKEFNLDIDSCESGFECIDKIEDNNTYDLILMDIMMPKIGGVETFKKLKQIDNFNTPVVALTADAIEGKANKYLEVGFNAYLSKPIDKIELNKVLDNILNNKQEEEEKEDPEVNKVIPITDDDIEMLNKLINKE